MYTVEKTVEQVMTKVTNWNAIWTILTVTSAVLMAAFWFLFRDDVLKKAAPAASGLGRAEAAQA
jgi:hypothetical protein